MTVSRPYRSTAEFDAASVPAALLRDHRIKAGAWGMLRVLAGRLTYHATGEEPRSLAAGDAILVPPLVDHRVELGDDARFRVDFYDHPPEAADRGDQALAATLSGRSLPNTR